MSTTPTPRSRLSARFALCLQSAEHGRGGGAEPGRRLQCWSGRLIWDFGMGVPSDMHRGGQISGSDVGRCRTCIGGGSVIGVP